MFYQLLARSFSRHPFTAEDPLVSRWSNATFLQIYSDEETLIFILDGLRVSKLSAHFHFLMGYSFEHTIEIYMCIYIYIYIY